MTTTNTRTHPTPPIPLDPHNIITSRILETLGRGRTLTPHGLAAIMTAAHGATDAAGAWDWKDAYDELEIATVAFLSKYGRAMIARSAAPHTMLSMLQKVAALLPTHTKRSEETQQLQQLSTPVDLAYIVSVAAAITASDTVLEPSAGTGLLAIFAEIAQASLILNELSDRRAGLLSRSFPSTTISRHDAAHIHD